jgi:hypothetical protein
MGLLIFVGVVAVLAFLGWCIYDAGYWDGYLDR